MQKIYEEGMLCKHFKGKDLYEKNIYKILQLEVKGTDIDKDLIKYTGDNTLEEADDLVVYQNIFQDNAFFTREYSDISSKLSKEKQEIFKQELKVQPLTKEECEIVSDSNFIEEKKVKTKKYVR